MTSATARLTVPDQLPGVELSEVGAYLKMLVYGPQGGGKTRFALTFCHDPRSAPVVWLDATGGTTAVQDEARATGAAFRSMGDAEGVIAYTNWLVAKQGGGFKTLVLDDFSEAFSITKGVVARATGKASAAELDPRDHGKLYERVLRVYRALRKVAEPVEAGGAGMHVLVTCWSEQKPRPSGGKDDLWWVPAFAGGFGARSAGYFDIVTYMGARIAKDRTPDGKGVVKQFRNYFVGMSDDHLVKDRFDEIGAELAMPTATMMLDALDRRRARIARDGIAAVTGIPYTKGHTNGKATE